jgi:hypothetical protein
MIKRGLSRLTRRINSPHRKEDKKRRITFLPLEGIIGLAA